MEKQRGSKVEITCKCGCGRKKMVRIADVKRGWGKYYSKSCKAKEQESRTSQYYKYMNKTYSYNIESSFHPHDSESLGQE